MAQAFSNGGASVHVVFDQARVYAGLVLTGTVTLTTGSSDLRGGALDLVFSGQEQAEWGFTRSAYRGCGLMRYHYTVNLASAPSGDTITPVTIPAGRTLVFPFSFPVPSDALPSYEQHTSPRKHFMSRHVATVTLTPHAMADLHKPVEAEFEYTVDIAIPQRQQVVPFELEKATVQMAPCHDLWTSCPCQCFCCCCCFYPCCCSCCAEDITVSTTLGQHAVIPGQPLPIAINIESVKTLISASYYLHGCALLDSKKHMVIAGEKQEISDRPIHFDTQVRDENVTRCKGTLRLPMLGNDHLYATFEGRRAKSTPKLGLKFVFDGGETEHVFIVPAASAVDPTNMAGFNAEPQPDHRGTLPLRVPCQAEVAPAPKTLVWLPEFPPAKVEDNGSYW